MTILTWTARVIMAAILAVWGVIGVNAARNGIRNAVHAWRRAGQLVDDARTDIAIAITCDPCHGKPGRCRCTSRCGHPDCVGDHTTFSRREVDELEELLRTEGNQS